MTLNTENAILEQLALGNKATRLQKRVLIDLQQHTKEESIEADFPRILIKDGDAPFQKDAEEWIDTYLPEYTSIIVKGKGGQVATLPYCEKDKLSQIISLFNT